MFRFYNTRVGTVAHLPSDQCIRASLETYGEWAHLELSLLRLLLGRGDTVFDVGANVGYHTMAFARFVGPFGHVVAFEPNPGAFRLANLTVAINDVQNVDLHQALVGSTAGSATVELVEVDGNLGAARFNQPAGGSRRNLVNVNSVRLDDFAHLAPDLVKIDVEGMQFDVLEGAQSLIAAARPMVFLEANEAGDVERAAKIFDAKHYRLVTFSAPAFNPANLCGATHDIFGGTAERGLLALPVERLEKLRRKHSALASLIEGGGDQLDWEAFSTLRDWGALRPWPEVHAMNEALLPTIRRTETKLPEDHPRIFVHIPKTAGTSLTESIKPIFGERAQEFYPANQFQTETYDFAQLTFGPGSLTYGHFQLVDRFLELRHASFLTVLRDPLDRAVSEFMHAIDRNMATSFGATLKTWPFDFGRSAEFDLAEYMLDARNRLFFTNTHIRYLGGLGVQPVQPRHVSETIDRLQGLHFVIAALPTLEEDVASWLGAGHPVTLRQSNTRGRLRASEVFSQETLDRLYEANVEDYALLRRLRPDVFSERTQSNVPSRDEELNRLAAAFARYAPKQDARA